MFRKKQKIVTVYEVGTDDYEHKQDAVAACLVRVLLGVSRGGNISYLSLAAGLMDRNIREQVKELITTIEESE